MTVTTLLFWLFALVACGSASLVVISQNVVRMAFWLVLALGSVAALFFLLHADFIGAAQLLIYVGGTVVLLIFGVMLTSSGPFLQIRPSAAEAAVGGLVGIVLLLVLGFVISGVDSHAVVFNSPAQLESRKSLTESESAAVQAGQTNRALGVSFLGLRGAGQAATSASGAAKAPVGYLFPFEIVSMHLLVVLVGAAYLARAKRRVDEST